MSSQAYSGAQSTQSGPPQKRRKVDQCAAICWRTGADGRIDVMLITSRDTGRWVIPKGNIDKREQQHQCARREAFEEAGVQGKIAKKAIGYYTYIKDRKVPLTVAVFPLLVQKQAARFDEQDQRTQIWLDPVEAAQLVHEPELSDLLRLIADQAAPALFSKAAARA